MTAAAPPALDAAELRRRAADDYLAVSRHAHLYASPEDYAAAEERAWRRLMAAIARDGGDGGEPER